MLHVLDANLDTVGSFAAGEQKTQLDDSSNTKKYEINYATEFGILAVVC